MASRVLVVDDQPVLCEFMVAAAEEAGWDAEAAETVADFERALMKPHPDALALDLRMPERDGVEMLRYLAKVRYRGKLVIVSGCDAAVLESTSILARHHGLDIVGCMQKPISAQAFIGVLKEIQLPPQERKRRNP